ncbi:MAG: hypothetical protein AAF483_14325, partial [Planctomycetota bacterium]
AGGGTDSINRMIMAEMEKHLPVGISVINQTGGVAGSNGMVYARFTLLAITLTPAICPFQFQPTVLRLTAFGVRWVLLEVVKLYSTI